MLTAAIDRYLELRRALGYKLAYESDLVQKVSFMRESLL